MVMPHRYRLGRRKAFPSWKMKNILGVTISFLWVLVHVRAGRHLSEPIAISTLTYYDTLEDGRDCLRSLRGVHDSMADWALLYPDYVEVVTMGFAVTSSFFDNLAALVVTNRKSTVPPSSKVPLVLSCGMLPFEASPAEYCLRFVSYLLTLASSSDRSDSTSGDVDVDIQWMLDYAELHVLVAVNPEGRRGQEATVTTELLYTNPVDGAAGISCGVNLGHNFPHSSWTSSTPESCSPTDGGSTPASEPEVSAVVEYLDSIMERTEAGAGRILVDLRVDPLTSTSMLQTSLLSSRNVGGSSESDSSESRALANVLSQWYNPPLEVVDTGNIPPEAGTVVDWATETLGMNAVRLHLSYVNDCSTEFLDDTVLYTFLMLQHTLRVTSSGGSLSMMVDVFGLRKGDNAPLTKSDDTFTVEVLHAIVPVPNTTLTTTTTTTGSSDDVASGQSRNMKKEPMLQAFLDVFPLDAAAAASSPIAQVVVETGTSTTSLEVPLDGKPGKHTVYVRAADGGPIYGLAFTIDDATAAPTFSSAPSITVTEKERLPEMNLSNVSGSLTNQTNPPEQVTAKPPNNYITCDAGLFCFFYFIPFIGPYIQAFIELLPGGR